MGESALAAGVASSLTFVVLNVAMNLYMKWLFAPTGGDFAFPWTMLAVQQLQAYMVLQPWIAWKYPAKRCGWDIGEERGGNLGWSVAWQVLGLTALFCLNVGLNSLSLVRISITLNQTVRAFLPVGVLLLATIVERRTYPRHSYVTTFVLIVGIGLTCWNSPDFEFYGFTLALASTIVAAIGSSLNGRLLSNGPFSKAGPEKIARLMMFQSVPAFFVFTLVAVITEGPQLHAALEASGSWQWHYWLCLVSVSSVLALMSNLGRCFLVAATSALMETLAGNAKVAALCIIDNQIFHTALYSYNYAGIALTFGGFSVHVLLQYASRPSEREKQEAEAAQQEGGPKLPVAPGTNGSFHGLNKPSPSSPISLPRMISGAETGLASEHLALQLGKPSLKGRRRRCSEVEEDEAGAGRRRAQTWQAGMDPTRTWLDRVGQKMGMDLAPVIEAPPWLVNEEDTESVGSGSPMSREWMASPTNSPRGGGGGQFGDYNPLVTDGGMPVAGRLNRPRIWSDMTHSAVGNPRHV